MAKASKDNLEPIDKFQPDPDQPRKNFNPEAMQALADSIKAQKYIYPILYREVVEDGETRFIIVDGERRWRACKELLGLMDIPAIKFEGDHEAVALLGNIFREDLTAMEEALAVDRLKTNSDNKLTNETLGNMLGKAESTISEILTLVKLPEYIQKEAIDNREWSRTKLLAIAKKRKDTKAQRVLFDRMKKTIRLTTGKREAKDKIETTKSQIEHLKSKLTKVDKDKDWTLDDKSALRQHLEELNKVIKDMLDSL